MGNRLTSEERRLQLVRAALLLLGELPVEQLTTRRLAEAVGLSQPAMFRHFASREQLLRGVVAYLRAELEALGTQALATTGGGAELLASLLRALFAFAERHPGAPRLLFHDAASGRGGGDLGAPLRQLIAGQTSFVAGLLTDRMTSGELPEGLDPVRASELFVALFQGELMRWHLEGEDGRPLAERVPGLVALFWAGVEAGQPASAGDEAAAPPAGPPELLRLLDTRPLLELGRDPFDAVQAALASLAPDGALALLVPFQPRPLVGLLEGRGWSVDLLPVELPGEAELQLVLIHRRSRVLDLRDLPAPEPLEAVLLAASDLAPGAAFLARLPRFPRLLLPRLTERGLAWRALELPAGEALLRVAVPLPEAPHDPHP